MMDDDKWLRPSLPCSFFRSWNPSLHWMDWNNQFQQENHVRLIPEVWKHGVLQFQGLEESGVCLSNGQAGGATRAWDWLDSARQYVTSRKVGSRFVTDRGFSTSQSLDSSRSVGVIWGPESQWSMTVDFESSTYPKVNPVFIMRYFE